jgi:excisionase family DNA binding protein
MRSSAKVLTVNELAEYLRVHRSTIYRLLKKGQLPGFKIGSDWRFNVEVIDEWRLKQGAAALAEVGAGPRDDDAPDRPRTA